MLLRGVSFSFSFFFLCSFLCLQWSKSTVDAASDCKLEKAYTALQAWKHAITSDPNGFTDNWRGSDVCGYKGVFCAPSPEKKHEITVAGIDLNHANISGTLPPDLGLLTDLALFHINTNLFTGTIPSTFRHLRHLYELDVSNNLFSGDFPSVVLSLPSLRYLDIRFNAFVGEVPDEVFDLKLDAFFINDNMFEFDLPENFGNSTVSAIVLANNRIGGCLPSSIGNMARTLNQMVLLNNDIGSCLPDEIGGLANLSVFDVSFNRLVGPLPDSFGGLRRLQRLDVAHNQLSAEIPDGVCGLPKLANFSYSFNFFEGEPRQCLRLKTFDDRQNCIPDRPKQRSDAECNAFNSNPVDCTAPGCVDNPPAPELPPPSFSPESYSSTSLP